MCVDRQGLKFAKDVDGLSGERHNVLLAHLHPIGRNTPFRPVEVDFRPLRLAQLAGPDKHDVQSHRLRKSLILKLLGNDTTIVAPNVAPQALLPPE